MKNLQTVEPIQETLRLLLKETGVSWKEVPNELGQGDFLVEGTKILVAYQPLVRPADIPGLVYQLKGRISQESHPAYGVIAADFISDASRDRIRDEGLGTLDRSGNCSIRFDRVLIEVRGNPNQFRTPKENKALFAPKAQRVLRALLSPPLRSWTGTELASVCTISPAWVSAVRKTLFAQEWAKGDRKSIRVRDPRQILKAWAAEDRWKQRTRIQEYASILPKDELCRELVREYAKGTIAFTRWTAAARRRPVTEIDLVTAYVLETPSAQFINNTLMAREVERNGNLQLVLPTDPGVFLVLQEVDGLPLVCDAQIWLDLQGAGNRAEEQAQALWDWEEFGGWNQ